jgi:hypothetical protein
VVTSRGAVFCVQKHRRRFTLERRARRTILLA